MSNLYPNASGYSDVATIGTLFTDPNLKGITLVSNNLIVTNSGGGDIVFENSLGYPQWFPAAQQYQLLPLAARRILSSGTVNGVSRSTTATAITWMASPPKT